MKKSLLFFSVLSLASAVSAQTGVTLTNVLDAASANVGNVYAATYSISDDQFLASNAGTTIRRYSGTTGAYLGDLGIAGITISGLGFFALAAGTDGSLFGFVDGEFDLWQWDNVADVTPTLANGTVPFSRTGNVFGTGNNTKLALTGDANGGPIHIFTTADDATYTETDTLPPGAPASKLCFAMNTLLTKAWAIADTGGLAINKAINTGTWASDGTFAPDAATNGAGALAYDSVNNVLFAFSGTSIHGLHGDTGVSLGNIARTNGMSIGYGGAVLTSTNGSGTLWMCGRGTTASNATLQKLTYTVAGVPSAVSDWSLY